MTHDERARRFVDRLLHDAHLRYQRQQLAPAADALPCNNANATPCPEVRGCRRAKGASERSSDAAVFKPEWFTGLRPNFWKAYFDTLLRCK